MLFTFSVVFTSKATTIIASFCDTGAAVVGGGFDVIGGVGVADDVGRVVGKTDDGLIVDDAAWEVVIVVKVLVEGTMVGSGVSDGGMFLLSELVEVTRERVDVGLISKVVNVGVRSNDELEADDSEYEVKSGFEDEESRSVSGVEAVNENVDIPEVVSLTLDDTISVAVT